MKAVRLRTEYLIDPPAVQTTKPRFSWELDDSRYGASQTAYEITVKSDGKVVWNTGKVAKSTASQIEYAGSALQSQQACEWSVRVWDADGKASPWSKAKFRIGKLKESDWSALWITTPDRTPKILPPHNGFHSELEKTDSKEKWVMVDLGSTRVVDTVVLYPTQPYDWSPPTPGLMFPRRFRIEASADKTFQAPMVIVDQTQTDYTNPGSKPATFKINPTSARYIRLVVTKLTERNPEHYGFALAELAVHERGTDVALGATVTASDSLENNAWGAKRLVDGDLEAHRLKGLESLPVTSLSKTVTIDRAVKSATLYATALGVYESSINGKKVGDLLLAPEWTDYHARVQYQVFDVTSMLKKGENTLGATLGDGWYAGRIGMAQGLDPRGYPRAVYGRRAWYLGQLEVEYADGTRAVFPTDDTWRASTGGSLRTSDIYDGEVHDLNFDNSNTSEWESVISSKETPGGKNPQIVAQTNEPIRVVDRVKPNAVTEPVPGVYVLDFGQNLVGRIQAHVNARAGDTVTFQYVEMLKDDGTAYTENLRGAPQRDQLVMPSASNGKPVSADFTTLFTYHGFRYLQITGLSKKPAIGDVTAEVFCSSSPENSTFECSDPLANKLWSNIFWTQRANLMSTPTDCPQRDERLGWMGDIQAFGQNAYYNMDMAGFFTKWLVDVRDAQADDGRYPDFAPHPYGKNDRFNGVPGWGDAGVVCAWVHYRNTGDVRLLDEHFDSARRWIDWIGSKNPNYLWEKERHNDYGDWLNGNTLVRDGWDHTGGEVPKDTFGTMMWYQSTRMVAQMAEVLDRDADAKKYHMEAAKIKEAFLKAYVKPDGEIKGDTQAGYALALYLDMLPAATQPKSFAKMIDAIDKRGGVLTTGFHSTLPMMEVLTKMGRNDLAYKVLLNKEFPGWGYTIVNGATTIWERWDGYVKGRGFQDPGMNSFNHWALGSVGQWMMESVIGISPDSPGYEFIRIAPRPGPGLTWAKGTYDSPKGEVRVAWKEEAKGLRLSFTVPANAQAIVDLPAKFDKAGVVKGAGHFRLLEQNGKQTLLCGSGAFEMLLGSTE